MKNLLLFTLALVISASLYGQRNDKSDYWNTWEYTPKDGMQQKFMEAAAKKTAMFNTTPETAIITYKVVTGSNSGMFVRVESGKSPASYDLDRTAEGKYWNENVAKYIAKNGGQVRWQRLSNGSYNSDPENSSPAKYVERTFYNVKADKILHFRRFMVRLSKVGEKRGWKGSRSLYRLISGGNRNQFVMAATFNTYKRAEEAKNENTFEEDYNKLFGWGSLDEYSQNFDASLEYWGEQRETLELVPEMSTGLMN